LPHGSRIAFSFDRDGDWEIYVVNTDGGGGDRLTEAPGHAASPTWRTRLPGGRDEAALRV